MKDKEKNYEMKKIYYDPHEKLFFIRINKKKVYIKDFDKMINLGLNKPMFGRLREEVKQGKQGKTQKTQKTGKIGRQYKQNNTDMKQLLELIKKQGYHQELQHHYQNSMKFIDEKMKQLQQKEEYYRQLGDENKVNEYKNKQEKLNLIAEKQAEKQQQDLKEQINNQISVSEQLQKRPGPRIKPFVFKKQQTTLVPKDVIKKSDYSLEFPEQKTKQDQQFSQEKMRQNSIKARELTNDRKLSKQQKIVDLFKKSEIKLKQNKDKIKEDIKNNQEKIQIIQQRGRTLDNTRLKSSAIKQIEKIEKKNEKLFQQKAVINQVLPSIAQQSQQVTPLQQLSQQIDQLRQEKQEKQQESVDSDSSFVFKEGEGIVHKDEENQSQTLQEIIRQIIIIFLTKNEDSYQLFYSCSTQDTNDIKLDFEYQYNVIIFLQHEHFSICIVDNSTDRINFFDPLSVSVSKIFDENKDYIIDKFKRTDNLYKLKYNENKIQDIEETNCGYQCLYFLIKYLNTKDYKFASSFDQQFEKNKKKYQYINQ